MKVREILEKYDELPMKAKIVISVFFLIIIIIVVRTMSKSDRNEYTSNINYKKISIESLLEDYNISYRDSNEYMSFYYIFKEYYADYKKGNSLKWIYSAIDKNYSKFISKRKFNEQLINLFNNFGENELSYSNFIMYKSKTYKNTYIFKVENSNKEICGYIGMYINAENNTYNIFFIA